MPGRIAFIFILILLTATIPVLGDPHEDKAAQEALAHEKLGDGYLSSGNQELAILEWEKAIRINPQNIACRLKLGTAYFNRGYIEKSIYYLKTGVSLSPRNSFAHYNLGLAFFTGGRDREAENELKSAIKYSADKKYLLYPHVFNSTLASSFSYTASPASRAHFFLGILYFKKGDYKNAVFELRHSFLPIDHFFSFRSEKERAMAFMDSMLGRQALQSNLDVTAPTGYFISLRDEKGNALFANSATLQMRGGGRLVTEEGYDTGISVPENMTDISVSADGLVNGTLMGRDNTLKNIGRLKLVTFPHPEKLKPRSIGIFEDNSESGPPAAVKSGDYWIAPGFRRRCEMCPDDRLQWVTLYAYGMELLSDPSLYKAYMAYDISYEKGAYERAIAGDESEITRFEALSALAPVYCREGKRQKAESMLIEAIRNQPDNGILHYNLGYLYFLNGDSGKAREWLEKALANIPPSSSWHNYNLPVTRAKLLLGLVCRDQKDIEKALRYLRESVGGDPDTSYEAYLPLSRISWERNEKEDALIYLFEYLRASFIPTGRALDVGIPGDGFFQVRDGEGHALYTRRGNFTLNGKEEIVTQEGHRTGITVPEGVTSLTLTREGAFYGIDRKGIRQELGKLGVFSLDHPEKTEDRYYYRQQEPAVLHTSSQVLQGFLNREPLITELGELKAFRFLAQITGNKGELHSLILSALLDENQDVRKRLEGGDLKKEWQDVSRYLAAKVYLYEGELENARALLEQVGGSENEVLWCLRESLITYLRQGGNSKSVLKAVASELSAIPGGDDESRDAHFFLGWAWDEMESPSDAIREYRKFLDTEKKGNCLPARVRLLISRIMGATDFALLEIMMPGHPGSTLSGFARCSTIIRTNVTEKKMSAVLDMSDEEKNLYALRRYGNLLERSGDLNGAIREYRKLVQARGILSPHLSGFISEDLIRAYFKVGMLDEVKNELDLARCDYRFYNEHLANLYRLLGDACKEKGEMEEARECHEESARIRENLKIRGIIRRESETP